MYLDLHIYFLNGSIGHGLSLFQEEQMKEKSVNKYDVFLCVFNFAPDSAIRRRAALMIVEDPGCPSEYYFSHKQVPR